MSKKKNTLKDLDEFLKQQAATLVSPQRLTEKPESSLPVGGKKEDVGIQPPTPPASTATGRIARDLIALAESERSPLRDKLCDLILQSLESQHRYSPEDKMLINTALYLKSGNQWKTAIRNYWKNKGY